MGPVNSKLCGSRAKSPTFGTEAQLGISWWFRFTSCHVAVGVVQFLLARCGQRIEIRRNQSWMQEKSKTFRSFFNRTEDLARKLRLNVSDLPAKIEVSASMFHSYRSGKYPISDKAWRKLEAAERAAEVVNSSSPTLPVLSENAENVGKVKEPGSDTERKVPMDYRDAFFKLAATGDLEWLQERIRELAEQAACGDVTAGETVALLTPLVAKRLEKDSKQ